MKFASNFDKLLNFLFSLSIRFLHIYHYILEYHSSRYFLIFFHIFFIFFCCFSSLMSRATTTIY